MKNYIVIDSDLIKERIAQIEEWLDSNLLKDEFTERERNIYTVQKVILEEWLSQSKPLQPILEEVYTAGAEAAVPTSAFDDCGIEEAKSDYLNSFEIKP